MGGIKVREGNTRTIEGIKAFLMYSVNGISVALYLETIRCLNSYFSMFRIEEGNSSESKLQGGKLNFASG